MVSKDQQPLTVKAGSGKQYTYHILGIPAFTGNQEQREHVQKLIDALRSGTYAQTTLTLRETLGGKCKHCFLGVACDVSNLGHWSSAGLVANSYFVGEYKTSATISKPVREFYGFMNSNAFEVRVIDDEFGPVVERKQMTSLNDDLVSFEDLAKILEYHLNGGLHIEASDFKLPEDVQVV
ncbi:hypothetical protein D3C87_459910 [compost metagenome]